MKVFILGASGLVGSNCQKYFETQGWNVTGSYFSFPVPNAVYYNTLDPNNSKNYDIIGWKPDVIVHCGALTNVDYCETHESESYQQTVESTKQAISLARQCQARLVYISTDYVFDGISGPYRENDATNPISIYGKHKLEAEQLSISQLKDTLVLRITNVYGDEIRGKNFVARIVDQCKKNQALTLKLPYDQYATPVNAWDIARAMFILLQDQKHGIYHIASTEYMNRVELASRILLYFPQAQYDLQPLSTENLKQQAARPLNGGLLKIKFSNEYPNFLFNSLDNYLRSII
ncbi:unnamed protein product [Didymodactylos carnosus]|uniref:Methionine adenosyltransferase 2 subunit beta n=1 Tax=Didymodactylos carnosus TaxID=1234261 RepID=A0A814RIZ2_9BILA|nr:unnamed protein product [Didymodactylos carnosus]CAF1362072.1 unnamed protein product [Didymodactylos carnosus]CAF3898014.1 unnamed protein product [Didymodactylos carnosus]CAF4171939.1 unnamed protein product [Didymodactylos carnosus]